MCLYWMFVVLVIILLTVEEGLRDGLLAIESIPNDYYEQTIQNRPNKLFSMESLW